MVAGTLEIFAAVQTTAFPSEHVPSADQPDLLHDS
jgi:hypothetical protein